MANVIEPTEEKLQEIEEWLKDRPEIIKNLCKQFPPYKLYSLKLDNCDLCLNKKVIIHSYHEDGTLTVIVPNDFNIALTTTNISGVFPEQLVECDIPTDNEIRIINYGNKCLLETNGQNKNE